MKLVLEETIAAPIQAVFELFTDLSHAADHIDPIQSLEVIGKGPVGKGTRFRETRVMFGKQATEEMEITAFDPPRSYRIEAESCGSHFCTVYSFEGGQRETRVTMETTSRPLSLFAKVVGPLMGLMMKGAMKKAMCADHANLKAVAEAAAGAGSSTGDSESAPLG